MREPTVLAIPIFVLTMAIEAFVLRRKGQPYDLKDTATSLSGGIGKLVVDTFAKGFTFAVFSILYEHRIASLGDGVGGAVALVLCEDLCFYMYHRTCHEVRLFWAIHVVHHSSDRYTLATALRQSWTSPFMGFFFWMPLPLLGFRPEHVALAGALSLLYQYGLHTETIGRLGVFEWVMNTPSHHRVHHGSNPQYIDRNHAGIFISWDRLFGTFEPEVEKPVYGLTKPVGTHNPVRVQFDEFVAIVRDAVQAKNLRSVMHAVFRNPGDVRVWREE